MSVGRRAARARSDDGGEQPVARDVTVGVVDLLEPVEVDEQHADVTGPAGEPDEGVRDVLEEHPARGQVGQRVVGGPVRELVLGVPRRVPVGRDDEVRRREVGERGGRADSSPSVSGVDGEAVQREDAPQPSARPQGDRRSRRARPARPRGARTPASGPPVVRSGAATTVLRTRTRRGRDPRASGLLEALDALADAGGRRGHAQQARRGARGHDPGTVDVEHPCRHPSPSGRRMSPTVKSPVTGRGEVVQHRRERGGVDPAALLGGACRVGCRRRGTGGTGTPPRSGAGQRSRACSTSSTSSERRRAQRRAPAARDRS